MKDLTNRYVLITVLDPGDTLTERLDEGHERKSGGIDESKVFDLSNLND